MGVSRYKKFPLTCKNCNNNFLSKNTEQICCSRQCSNTYQGKIRKNTIDPKTGKTYSHIFAKKADISRRENGWYDSDKYKENIKIFINAGQSEQAIKKRAEYTLMAKKKNHNGMSLAQIATQKSLKTKAARGIVTPLSKKSAFARYKWLVWYYTKQNNLTLLPGYNKRGRLSRHKNYYQLDHIYSIFDGFNNKVPPEIIGNIANLRFIPAIDNLKKNNKSEISLKNLFRRCGKDYSIYYPDKYIEIKKSKCSAAKMNSKQYTCKYCNITTTAGIIGKYHNEKCKNK